MDRAEQSSLGLPRLVVLTDFAAHPGGMQALREACARVQAGELAIVLRDRQLPPRELLRLGEELRQLTQQSGHQLWVSDRLDLARSLGADGVHLPTGGLLPTLVRPFARVCSRAAHDAARLPDTELSALDALLLSPVFAPRKGRAALGLGGFARRAGELWARAPALGVYALGGVNHRNAMESLRAGACGVAVMGAILGARPSAQGQLFRALGIAR